MDQFSWVSDVTANLTESQISSYPSGSLNDSFASQPVIGFISSIIRESASSSNEDLLKDFSPDRILAHCFKPVRCRNAHPYCPFKLKATRFGLPRSRRRILIAAPIGGPPPGSHKPQPPVSCGVDQKVKDLEEPPEAPDSVSSEESSLQELEDWIEERKQLHYLLDNCANLEEWLNEKKPVTKQEQTILRKLREERKERTTKITTDLLAVGSVKMAPKPVPLKTTPVIHSPYPESIITLQNLLHKQKLRLMDIFKKADRTRTMRFKRTDFLRIIQETKIPISKNDLEEIIVYLTISRKGDLITSADLAECQRIWVENVREQWKQPKQETLCVVQAASTAAKEDVTPFSKPSVLSPKACQPQSNTLEVPPVNTEPDRMHLTYNKMEIVGKRYKEMRRRLKRKTDPLDFAEQCRLVRSGDPMVDHHCLPSSIEGEIGELVDHHRLASHLAYFGCVKLCEKYGIPISEETLKRGLLYPGDRLLRLGNSFQKIRQPGSFFDTSIASPVESPDESRSSPKVEKRKPKPEPVKKIVKKKPANSRWESFAEFKRFMRNRSQKMMPPEELWNDDSLVENPDLFIEKYVQRELRKMFSYLNPLTKANSFWPGHLLDKIRLCPPISGQDGSDVLFSRVPHKRPVYPGIYNPHRTWPVSGRYVTSGDSELRKHLYYI